MKKSSIVVALLAFALSGTVFADSTHVCQGNSCNDGGSGGGTVTGTNTNLNLNSLSQGQGQSQYQSQFSNANASAGSFSNSNSSALGIGGGASSYSQGGLGIGLGGSAKATGGTALGFGGSSLVHDSGNSRATAHGGEGGKGGQGGTAAATSGGNVMQGGDVNVTTNVRPAASAPANSLTSVGTDNCLGSVSGSFGNGFISFGGGSTTESVECNRRANSRRLEAMGYREAAVALQCMNEEVRSAMKLAGTPCVQDQAAKKEGAANVSGSHEQASNRTKDPFICARTGEGC